MSGPSKSIDPSLFASVQRALLAAEQAAELSEATALVSTLSPRALQRAGVAITGLVAASRRTGMGGRTVLELVRDAATMATSAAGGTRGGGDSGDGTGTDAADLPEHGIRVGDVIIVAEMQSSSATASAGTHGKGGKGKSAGKAGMGGAKNLEKIGTRAVVVRVQRASLSVALDEDDETKGKGEDGGGEGASFEGRLWVVKIADDVTYKRMDETMERLQKMPEQEYSSFIRALFGLSSLSPVPADLSTDPKLGNIEWFDPTLNESQKDAVRFALASTEIALVHGPPGTGKTHTLIELILQLLHRGQRLLVCGPSNVSVDNIVERLSAQPTITPSTILRLGHPARLLPSVLSHSLDVATRTSEAGHIVADVRAEMDSRQAALRKTRNGRERRLIYAELRELRREFRERERRCVEQLVRGARVVLSTLHGAGSRQLKGERFDVVIIDEASQALEAQCWVALLGCNAEKAVLAGDHLQLPPTIKSLNSKGKLAAAEKQGTARGVGGRKGTKTTGTVEEGNSKEDGSTQRSEWSALAGITLETTLFDRLLSLHGPAIKRMLTTQYRMHERIMAFPSAELYEGKLVAAEAVKARLLRDLSYGGQDTPAVKATDDTVEPLVFIDTQGGDFPERSEEDDSTGGGGGEGKSGKKTSVRSLLAESKSNEMEAALVVRHVQSLIEAGVRPEDIAVVTPYNAQLALLAPLKERFPGLELGSVDGFQGREKEAVVVSLVRSNEEGDVGFLGEKRRLNVAMTRARRSLTVIGDSETVKKGNKFLKDWMEFLEENADLRYPDVTSLAEEA